jgi:alpha-1,6-mannosyltransferase
MFSRFNSIIFLTVLLGAVSSIPYIFHFDMGWLAEFIFPHRTDITSTHLLIFQFLVLNTLYFFVVYVIFKSPHQLDHSRGLLLVLFLFAVFFRFCLVGATPQFSSDMYRYVWDGRVQSEGINPYTHPPSSDSLASLRDKAIYPHINRKKFPTIYPAGAQIFFLASHKLVGGSVRGLKAVLVFFDVLTMIVLILLLRTFGLEESRFVVYAWNPLVILEISHSGHLEGFCVFLVLLAFFLYSMDKKTLGMLSLACASATKIYPALLLPAFIKRGERIKSLAIFFSCVLLFYLPYVSAGKKMLGFLPIYFRDPYESFNLGLKYFLMHMFPRLDYFLLTKILVGIVLAAGLIIFLKDKKKEEVLKYSFILISLQLIFMPAALHPWYVVWLIPLLAFYPSPAWLLFSCTVVFSYLKYGSPEGIMESWILYVEYLPLYLLLLAEYLGRQRTSPDWFPWRPKHSILL